MYVNSKKTDKKDFVSCASKFNFYAFEERGGLFCNDHINIIPLDKALEYLKVQFRPLDSRKIRKKVRAIS